MLYHLPVGGGLIDPNPSGSMDLLELLMWIWIMSPVFALIYATIQNALEDNLKREQKEVANASHEQP